MKMNLRQAATYTYQERLVLIAIGQGADTPYIIARDTGLDKLTVGDAIANLANRGDIKHDSIRGWVNVHEF